MIILNNSIGYTMDADASKVIEAIRATGVTITHPMRNYAHTLVSGLKGTGMWQNSLALYGFLGGTAASHALNWKDLRDLDAAYRLVFFNSPSHNSSGVLWNGTTQYANTFLIPNSVLSTTSTHLSYYTPTNNLTGVQIPIGALSASTNFLQLNFTSANFISGTIGSAVSYTPTSTRGYTIGSKITANNQFVYRNSVKIATNTTSSSVLPSNSIYLGARNNTTSPFIDFYSVHTSSFASIGSGLTDSTSITSSQVVTQAQAILNRA